MKGSLVGNLLMWSSPHRGDSAQKMTSKVLR
jgi:hypothetical protein